MYRRRRGTNCPVRKPRYFSSLSSYLIFTRSYTTPFPVTPSHCTGQFVMGHSRVRAESRCLALPLRSSASRGFPEHSNVGRPEGAGNEGTLLSRRKRRSATLCSTLYSSHLALYYFRQRSLRHRFIFNRTTRLVSLNPSVPSINYLCHY